MAMKRHQKKVQELEEQNKSLQKENEELRDKLANVLRSSGNDGAEKLKADYFQKLNMLEEQVSELKRKLDAKSQLSTQKPKADETTKRLLEESYKIKAQKVDIQRKMKEESIQFRLCKALLEKEIIQLKKEAIRKEYKMQNLLALNQRQKMVLQQKIAEASLATRRPKGFLKSHKAGSCPRNGNGLNNQVIGHDPEIEMHGRCSEYQHQNTEMHVPAKNDTELKVKAEIQKQKNLRCLLQDMEIEYSGKDLEISDLLQTMKVDCKKKDSEIRELKEEVLKLNSLVRQLEVGLICKEKSLSLTPRKQSKENAEASFSSNLEDNKSELTDEMNTSEQSKDKSGACCSCSKRSLCKTLKCECRAGGGSCGSSCGCVGTRCTNRKAVVLEESVGSLKSDAGDGKKCLGAVETDEAFDLASRGAVPLRSVLVEDPSGANENENEIEKQP